MPKEDRIELPSPNLPVGTKAKGTYRGSEFDLEVVQADAGIVYRVTPPGSDHATLSAATKSLFLSVDPNLKSPTPAVALTKWWSLVELGTGAVPESRRSKSEPSAPKEKKARTAKAETGEKKKAPAAKRKPSPNLKRMRIQKDVPDGKIAWFCSACQDGFLADYGEEPATCPKGHTKDLPDELAPQGVAAVADDEVLDITGPVTEEVAAE